MTLRDAGVALIDCVHATPVAAPLGYPYVAIPDMKNGRIDFSRARRISKADFEKWTTKARPRRHDVVLSRRTNPGVTAAVEEACEFALGQNLVLLRADGRHVVPEFLKWLVSGPEWWEQIGKFLNVGAVFDSLKCADVPGFHLPIPPKHEQRRIVSILGALDDKIDLNRRMNETLEATARTLFRDWFVDFGPSRAKMEGRAPYLAPDLWSLFPDRLDEEGKPEGWTNTPLSTVVTLSRETLNPATYPDEIFDHHSLPAFDAGRRPVPEPGDCIRSNKNIIPHGAILFSKLNPEIPRVWLADVRDGVRAISSTEFLVLSAKVKALREFSYCCASERTFRQRVEAMVSGTSKSHQRASPAAIMNLDVVLPPHRLLEKFHQIAKPVLDRLLCNRREVVALAAIRDLLLPKLMSGEIRVRDAEKVLEAAL